MAQWSEIEDFALGLDGVEAANSYGEPSLKVGRTLLCRHRIGDDSVVLKSVDMDERDMLIATRPEIFFVEDHYRQYDIVLARLPMADLNDLTPYITRAWLQIKNQRHR